MKKIYWLLLATILCACEDGNVNLQSFQLQSLDQDRAIMVDKNREAVIISKSGQVLKRVDLKNSTLLPMDKEFTRQEIHD